MFHITPPSWGSTLLPFLCYFAWYDCSSVTIIFMFTTSPWRTSPSFFLQQVYTVLYLVQWSQCPHRISCILLLYNSIGYMHNYFVTPSCASGIKIPGHALFPYRSYRMSLIFACMHPAPIVFLFEVWKQIHNNCGWVISFSASNDAPYRTRKWTKWGRELCMLSQQ